METQFTIIQQNRKLLYHYLKNTPKEDLFQIPKGFNNNIWWNIAHVVVTEQILVYKLSGLPVNVPNQVLERYKKGTFPEGIPPKEEVEAMTKLLFSLPQKTKEDYLNGVFTDFEPYMTTPKVGLNSVEDAIAFNAFHEGLHLGSIMALARAVKN